MGYKNQYIASLFGSIGALCLGCALGWSGPVNLQIISGKAYSFTPSRDEYAWAASVLTLGAACSCLPTSILSAKYGRKTLMLALILPMVIGLSLLTMATKPFMLILGRLLVGASVGPYCVLVPVYCTEVAEIQRRGVTGCFYQIMLVHGLLFSFVAGGYCSVFVFNLMSNIIPIIYLLMFVWMPESPTYYMQVNKPEKAEKVLIWLRGNGKNVSAELSGISAKAEEVHIASALVRPRTLKGLAISIMLLFYQQFTGINGVCFYLTSIFDEADTSISPELCTIIIGIVGCVAIIPAILFIDSGGRRIFLIMSTLLMAVMCAITGIYFMWLKNNNVGWLPIIAICIYFFAFSMGLGPVPWLINAELFSEDVKLICTGIASTCCYIFAFAVTSLFPLCVYMFGPAYTFWGCSIISLTSLIFVIFFVPETKGKTLGEIQTLLESKQK